MAQVCTPWSRFQEVWDQMDDCWAQMAGERGVRWDKRERLGEGAHLGTPVQQKHKV
jgi:hypothetical protein